MYQKLPGIIILFFAATIGGYYLWQYGVDAAATFTADRPSFQADLKNTLDLQAGVGKPTFTRATTATVTDFEGLIKNVKSGEARFEGARRVENLLTHSEDFSNAVWVEGIVGSKVSTTETDPLGGNKAVKINNAAGANAGVIQTLSSTWTGSFTFSVWLKSDGTNNTVSFSLQDGSGNIIVDVTGLSITSSWKRYSITGTSVVGTSIKAKINRNQSAGNYWIAFPQVEQVTGQANQNPSEYVSVGVKTSAPYHGSNVDGVKYFTTYNGNTVTSNVVTEATDGAIPDATLHGYVAEGARTNLLLRSNTFNTNWVQQFTTITQDQIGMDGVTSAWTLTDSDGSNANVSLSVSLTAGTEYSYSLYFKKTVGAQSSYPVLSTVYFAATPERALATIDTTNGVATVWTSYTGATVMTSSASCISANTDFWRCTLRFTPLTTVSHAIYFLPAGASTNNKSTGTFDGAATGSAVIWGAQLEAGAFASSYIPTTTASVTRNGDVLTYPTAGNFDPNKGTVYIEPMFEGLGFFEARGYLVFFTEANPRLALRSLDTSINFVNGVFYNNSTAYSLSSDVVSVGTKYKYGFVYGATAVSLFQNGVKKSTDTTHLPPTPVSVTSMGIGSTLSSNQHFGTIRNVKIWKKALTDTQLTNMTSTNTAVSQSAVKTATVGADGESFRVDLKNTLDLQAGIGKPTFTRATIATVTDFEGLIKNVKSGEARFEGARRVENLLTYSEDFSVWSRQNMVTPVEVNVATAPDGTMTADRITFDADGLSNVLREIIPSAGTYILSVYAKTDSSPKQFRLSTYSATDGAYASGVITTTSSWVRYSFVVTVTTSTYVYVSNYGTPEAGTALFWGYQVEKVTGQANQNPSEYVSTNVKTSAPYHGANVDGVKYFTTYNGNTVASNVVTEATGASIPDATLHGYVAEGARTNLALQSEDFSTSYSYTGLKAFGSGSTVNVAVAPSGATTADLITEDSSTGVHRAYLASIVVANATVYTASVYVKASTRSRFALLTQEIGNRGRGFDVSNGTTFALTGGEVGATIYGIQALPGGWYRVWITFTTDSTTSSLQVRLVDSGTSSSYTGDDASGLYVWGAQFEAGAFASSYIPTTTASVTRNADVLTYPTAGNFSDTAGSAYAEYEHTLWTQNNNHRIIGNVSVPGAPLFSGGGSAYRSGVSDGTTALSGLADGTQGMVKGVSKWGVGKMRAFSNGLVGNEGNYDGSFNLTSLGIGMGTVPYFGTIRNVKIWKKALTDTQLTNMTSTNTAVSQSAVKKKIIKVTQSDKFTSGLVGMWSFNGPDMSGLTAIDRSGQNNNGTLTGGAQVVLGKNGQGIQFDGVDDYVDVGNTGENATSISLWFYNATTLSSASNISCVMALNNVTSPAQQAICFGISTSFLNNEIITVLSNTGASGVRDAWCDASATIPIGWHHLVTAWNGTHNEIYLDGVKKTITSYGANEQLVASTLKIGGSTGAGTTGYFNGKIDEVRIYNRALSATEVTQLYNLGK